MAHPIDRAAETGDNFLRPLSGCTLRDQEVVCEVLFRASSRGLRAVWLCNNKFASKGGFLAAQKEDAWQFSTSTFWSLSVQSFIALESRLLISPPFFFVHPSPSGVASASTLAEIRANPFAGVTDIWGI